jgi:hypothetical protein
MCNATVRFRNEGRLMHDTSFAFFQARGSEHLMLCSRIESKTFNVHNVGVRGLSQVLDTPPIMNTFYYRPFIPHAIVGRYPDETY